MRSKKGTYKIATNEGWVEKEGSFCHCFPFVIHRESHQRQWTISHMATGYQVIKEIARFKDAKKAVDKLKPFSVFLMPDLETWNKALLRLQNNKPKEYTELISIISQQWIKR